MLYNFFNVVNVLLSREAVQHLQPIVTISVQSTKDINKFFLFTNEPAHFRHSISCKVEYIKGMFPK